MYRRSADGFLGLPFNIASTALLTTIFAHQCDLNVGTITICLGDVHLYQNHLTPILTQCQYDPKPFPRIMINCPKPDNI